MMWCLIWVCTVCLGPFYGFPSKNGLRSATLISKLFVELRTHSMGAQNKTPITAPFAIIVTASATSVLYAVISLVVIILKRRNKWNFLRKPESAGQKATSTNPRQEREDDHRHTECMQYSQGAYGYSPETANVCRNNRPLSDTYKEINDTTASGRYYDAGVFHAVYEQIQPEIEYHDKEYLELDQRHM